MKPDFLSPSLLVDFQSERTEPVDGTPVFWQGFLVVESSAGIQVKVLAGVGQWFHLFHDAFGSAAAHSAATNLMIYSLRIIAFKQC